MTFERYVEKLHDVIRRSTPGPYEIEWDGVKAGNIRLSIQGPDGEAWLRCREEAPKLLAFVVEVIYLARTKDQGGANLLLSEIESIASYHLGTERP